MINIDQLINDATKQRSPSVGVYRLMKAEFLRWMKDNPGKKFDETVEQKILKKMYDQRVESIKQFESAGREDLVKQESEEASYISPFLPVEVPEEEIVQWTRAIIENDFSGTVSMKDMKTVLVKVQEKYPGASGKVVSGVVKSYC